MYPKRHFVFLINWKTKFKILHLFSFLIQIIKMEILKTADFFMLIEYLLWISYIISTFHFHQKIKKNE